MYRMHRMNGYRGDWGSHGGWGRGPHPMFLFPMMLLAGFVFFGLFKFLFPLILLGLVFMGVRALLHGGFGGRNQWRRFEGQRPEFWNHRWNWENQWSEKRKHDESDDDKPKRGGENDSPRYARTANGDWVEII